MLPVEFDPGLRAVACRGLPVTPAASLTGDVLAECLDAGDEAAGLAAGIGALEAGGAEVFVLLSGAEHVPDNHEHRVGDGDNRLVLGCGEAVAAVVGDVPVVQGLEVADVATAFQTISTAMDRSRGSASRGSAGRLTRPCPAQDGRWTTVGNHCQGA